MTAKHCHLVILCVQNHDWLPDVLQVLDGVELDVGLLELEQEGYLQPLRINLGAQQSEGNNKHRNATLHFLLNYQLAQ